LQFYFNIEQSEPHRKGEARFVPNRLRGAVGSKCIREVSPSAEGDKRNFLKKVSFESSKTFPLFILLRFRVIPRP
jgi:hypothetical protein